MADEIEIENDAELELFKQRVKDMINTNYENILAKMNEQNDKHRLNVRYHQDTLLNKIVNNKYIDIYDENYKKLIERVELSKENNLNKIDEYLSDEQNNIDSFELREFFKHFYNKYCEYGFFKSSIRQTIRQRDVDELARQISNDDDLGLFIDLMTGYDELNHSNFLNGLIDNNQIEINNNDELIVHQFDSLSILLVMAIEKFKQDTKNNIINYINLKDNENYFNNLTEFKFQHANKIILNENLFEQLYNLQLIDLDFPCEFKPGCLNGLNKLQSLKINTNNSFIKLSNHLFTACLENLKYLYIINSAIHIESNAFKNLKSLEEFCFDKCHLIRLESGGFDGLENVVNLKSLILDVGPCLFPIKIDQSNLNQFKQMAQNLERLKLSSLVYKNQFDLVYREKSNRLTHLIIFIDNFSTAKYFVQNENIGLFNKMTGLVHLELHGSKMFKIKINHLKKAFFNGLTNLKCLMLNFLYAEKVESNAFSTFGHSLEHLIMENCCFEMTAFKLNKKPNRVKCWPYLFITKGKPIENKTKDYYYFDSDLIEFDDFDQINELKMENYRQRFEQNETNRKNAHQHALKYEIKCKMRFLGKLKNLRKLQLFKCRFNKIDMAIFDKLDKLEEVRIQTCNAPMHNMNLAEFFKYNFNFYNLYSDSNDSLVIKSYLNNLSLFDQTNI